MKKRQASIKDVLDATFLRAKKIDSSEIELRADFARHLCVLVSGFLDQTIKNYTAEYVAKRSNPAVTNYVVRSIKNLTNLKAEKLKQHVLSFDSGWQTKIDELIADERKDAIDSLVNLRHGIAHGQPDDVTLVRIEGYYKEIVKVVDGIRDIMQLE
ncbi:MAG TPA: HEPN domain-containing protein [Luteimonas sp.]|nr:HEPN domain-containing protein [Luteimonas sp.]